MSQFFAQCKNPRNADLCPRDLNRLRAARHRIEMPTTTHIHLRAHRNRTGLTQEQVANIVGKGNSTISHWEAGTRTLDLEDLEALAKVYGVHPVALLLAPEDGPRADAIRRASEVARRMEQQTAEEWLKIGERLAPPPSE